jgi:hypothetical protein
MPMSVLRGPTLVEHPPAAPARRARPQVFPVPAADRPDGRTTEPRPLEALMLSVAVVMFAYALLRLTIFV